MSEVRKGSKRKEGREKETERKKRKLTSGCIEPESPFGGAYIFCVLKIFQKEKRSDIIDQNHG